MARLKMHDLIVVLPGITGTVLRQTRSGKEVDVWAISGQALWRALTSLGDSLQDLRLPRHDPRGAAPDTALHADGLVNDFHGIFGLWRIDGYDTTLKALMARFELLVDDAEGAIEKANLIPFGYDWRLSNRVSARALKALVDRRLARYRKATNNPLAKVILIAHSMGGLVSRYWLEVLGGWHDCRTLVTFGTPYRGAVEALNYLANGFKKAAFNRTLLDLSDVVRSCPAAYELLPCYDVLKVGDTWVTPAATEALPAGIDREYLLAARDFHADIACAIKTNLAIPEYAAKPYPIFPVVGVHQATLNSARLANGTLTPSELRPDWLAEELEGGDGTVPRYSASPEDRADDLREIFFAECHGSLQRNDHVLTDLVERLAQMQVRRPLPVRGGIAVPAQPIALHAEALYLLGEPVTLSVDAEGIERFGTPRLRIAGRRMDFVTRELPFVKSGDTWTLTLADLQAGQYALQVDSALGGPGAPTPVHEVIEIAG